MSLKTQIFTEAKDLCGPFGIKRLSLFGSVARGEENPDSDIDFLAEFDTPSPDSMPERYFGFLKEANRRFGREVQVSTPRMIRNPHLKRSIDQDMTTVYERRLD